MILFAFRSKTYSKQGHNVRTVPAPTKCRNSRQDHPWPQPHKKQTDAVKALIELWNSPTMKEEEFVQLWCDEYTRRYHEEDLPHGFTPWEAATRATMFRASFPDAKMSYEDIQVRGNIVTVLGVRTSGTHTGAPFQPMELYPAILANGIFCENDEEELCIELDQDLKIKRCRIISLGSTSGMSGFYEQIGGKICSNAVPRATAA